MAIPPISPITAMALGNIAGPLPAAPAINQAGGPSFTQLLNTGLEGVEQKLAKADALMKAYALGESVPVHQVTIALEEARLAVEMSVQVRERLTEVYRSFMNMQL